MKRTLQKRDVYLNKLIAFKDTEPVKAVRGIRRRGKSSLLKLTVEHLKENGISDSNYNGIRSVDFIEWPAR